MIAQWFTQYYSKPRNKFFLLLGAFFIAPVMRGVKKDVEDLEKELQEKTMLLGRLELTATMLSEWWKK